MNLIERLGGYDVVKEKYQALSDSDMITIGPVEFSAKDYFENELLEYRRQHNIFEVGDKVVFIHPFELGDLFTVHSISERFIGVKSNNGECIYYAEIVWGLKHANDAEIKAGKRLEVNDGN